MKIVAQPDTSGNILTSNPRSLPNNGDFAAGYLLLNPHEIDPNPGELPPSFRDELQAALNAQRRGFELIQLGPDGTPLAADWRSEAMTDDAVIRERWTSAPRSKVGGITDGLIVLALTGAAGEVLFGTIEKTAAVRSRVRQSLLLVFRLPAGIRNPATEAEILLDACVVLPSDGYIELPSGGATDACCWVNRYPIAAAPQWLLNQLDQLAALAASQTQIEGDNDMGTRNEVTERLRNGQFPTAAAPIEAALTTEMAEDISDEDTDEKDTSEIGPPEPPEPSNVVRFRKPKPKRYCSKLEAALDHARNGWRVFPLLPDSKKPPGFMTKWQFTATTDEARIRQWWAKNADYNIAGVTDHRFVPDVDPRNGGSVEDLEFVWPIDERKKPTQVSLTAGGGAHFIFDLVENLRLKSRPHTFGKGLDLKTGSGAYILLPGSTIDGREYRWLEGHSPDDITRALAPPSLIEIARKAGSTKPKSEDAGKRLVEEDEEAIELARRYIEARAPQAEQGERNDTAIVVACELFERGVSKGTCLELMLQWTQSKCDTPLEVEELQKVVDSASGRAVIGLKHSNNPGLKEGFDPVEIDESRRPERHVLVALAARFPQHYLDTFLPEEEWGLVQRLRYGRQSVGEVKDKEDTSGEPTDLWADVADPADLAAGILPPIIECWVNDEAQRKGVDRGVMAVPAVVACASAIPAQFRLQVKQEDTGHTTCGILWGTVVGGPGSRKSPVLGAARALVQSVEATWAERNRKAQKEYEERLAAYKSQKGKGDDPEPLPARILRKVVMDATMESLTAVLQQNPAGLLCFRDELAQWAGNMDAYRPNKSVSRDEGFWLEAKEGEPYTVDRVGRGTSRVEVNAVHVVGGIQPDVLRRLAPTWGGNGLLQRFLIVIARTARLAIDRAPDQDAASAIKGAIRVLMNLEWNAFVPVFRFCREADAWRQKVLAFAAGLITQAETPLPLRGWLEKLEGEWARLCLVFHFIEWAGRPDADRLPPELISAETAIRAARFLIEFQYPQQQAFYRSVAGLGAQAESDAQWIAGHILHHKLAEIDERGIEHIGPRLRGLKHRGGRLTAARSLEEMGWLLPAGRHRTEGHVNKWTVNPAVHDGRFATRAAAEAARCKEAQEGIRRAAEIRRALSAA